MFYNNVLETIGNTPLIKINNAAKEIPGIVLAKVESFNPGHSIKDRIAVKLIEDAEQKGLLKPGGTVIECTSGNTGMGLALAAIVKGYKCIFTMSDKQSKSKIDILKALGAQVVVCPNDVAPEDPRSFYSVAKKLNEEIPNSIWCDQYSNLVNTEAHFSWTGKEIWEQTEGKLTHLVATAGTGGTLSGIAKYLKGKNPDIRIWGIDTYGSVLKKFFDTGVFDPNENYPYLTEAVGKDFVPGNLDCRYIDHFEKVTDKDGALAARKLAKEEGLLLGYSSGSCLAGIHQLKHLLNEDSYVVFISPDHGSRYLSKIYNDDWMNQHGFLDEEEAEGENIDKLIQDALLNFIGTPEK